MSWVVYSDYVVDNVSRYLQGMTITPQQIKLRPESRIARCRFLPGVVTTGNLRSQVWQQISGCWGLSFSMPVVDLQHKTF